MSAAPEQLLDGLWRWTAQHPEWHPGDFGSEVASFALRTGQETLLIDPLLPRQPGPVLDLIEQQLGERLAILITIPYHVRSSEEIRDRFRGQVETAIWGHQACRKRLADAAGFRAFEPGDALPAGASAYRIGRPRRFETPLHLPSPRALVFGDAVAEVDGDLRVWSDRSVDADVSRFYRERFNPTLEPLLELDFDRVLVTHGRPALEDGRKRLAKALRAEPWYHRD
ncbi:MAG: MBL fold metallo-hydrolase [Thermoleophilaceae bacterium]|nr:MBL fold metallo-hydrolase [Thermoleophilaceae bacterium]